MNVNELRQAGFDDAEIETHLKDAGFNQSEILQYLSPQSLADSGQQPISTITGKPVPTTDQEFESRKNMIRTVGPIVGDIAGTMLMPQLGGAKMGIRGINLLMRAMGAAGGSGAGSIASDVVTGGKPDIERAGEQALLGAGGEVGMGVTGGALKMAKPLFEFVPNITFSGSAVKKAANNMFKERATKRAESFLLDIAPEAVSKQADVEKSLSVMVNNAFSETSGVYKLYESALEQAAEKEGGVVLVDDTAQFVNDLFEKARGSLPSEATKTQIMSEALKEFNYGHNLKLAISELQDTSSLTPRKVEYVLTQVFKNKGYNKLNPTQQEARERFKDVLMSDMDKYIEFNPAQIKRMADAEYKALAKFNAVRKIFNKALKVVDPDTGRKALHPHELYEQIFAHKDQILKDPVLKTLWPKLEIEALAAKDFGDKITKTAIDVGPSSVFSRGLGAAGGGLVLGPLLGSRMAGAGVVEGIGAASAWAMMDSLDKQYLKKIFKYSKPVLKSLGKTGIHMGGQEVGFGKAE